MEHDFKFYVIVFVLAVLSIASALTLNIFLILGVLIATGALVVFHKIGYILESFLFKRFGIIQVMDGYELCGDRAAIIRRIGNRFCATAVAFLEGSSSEPIEKGKIESIIKNCHYVFKHVMQVEKIDTNRLIDKLQTKRSMREIELSRLSDSSIKGNISKINSLKRHIGQIDHEIDKINSGGIPLRISQYIMTSAISENKFNAQERAKSQIRELASQFGALMGAKSDILSGNELIDIIKFDSGVNQ